MADDLGIGQADYLDDGDDLFDFDELVENAGEIVEELTSEQVVALDESPEVVRELLVEEMPSSTPGAQPVPAQEAAPTPPPAEAYAPGQPGLPVATARRPRLAFGVAALVVTMIANLALVGLTWKSLDTTRALVERAPAPSSDATPRETVSEAPADVAPTDAGSLLVKNTPPAEDPPAAAYAVLFEAETSIDAGDFRRGRRTLFGLLAVIDRVTAPERADVEAKAGFLVAESYRLEAREHAGGGE